MKNQARSMSGTEISIFALQVQVEGEDKEGGDAETQKKSCP